MENLWKSGVTRCIVSVVSWWKASDNRTEKLFEELENVKRTVSLLRLEWSDVQDLLTKRLRRLAKEAKAVQTQEDNLEQASGPELSANEQLILSRLPPAQREAQQRILLNRKQRNGG